MLEFFDTLWMAASAGIARTIVIAVISILVANVALKAFERLLDKLTRVDKTLVKFIKSVVRFAVYFFVVMFIANSLGFDTSSIVALASVFTAAFALAAQNVLSNLFGGMTMLATRPFNVGDYVIAGGVEGIVKEISMFYTVLMTVDNKKVTVPNGVISSATITNCSSDKRRVDVNVSASYNCKLDDVKAALMEAVAETNGIINDPAAPVVYVTNYGESAIS